MKHVYYGLKQEAYVKVDNWFVEDIDNELCYKDSMSTWRNDFYKKELDSFIEKLSNNDGSCLIYIDYHTIGRNEFIEVTFNTEVLDVGHKVSFLDLEGKVVDRKYDPVNDIMYYYTDVVMEKVIPIGTDEKLQKSIDDMLVKCLQVKQAHFPTVKNVAQGQHLDEKCKNTGETTPWFKKLKFWH